MIRLLVEAGARQDVKDKLWDATALGWAEYAGRDEAAEYLRRLPGAGA